MSLILDALKKSEREQEREPDVDGNDLGEVHRRPSMDQQVLALLGVAALIILLLVVLLVVLLWPKTDSTAVPGARPEVGQAPVARELPAQPRPVPPQLVSTDTASEPATAFRQQPSPQEDPQVQALYQTDVAASAVQVPEPPQVATVEPQGLTPEQQHIDAVWRQMQAESSESLLDLRQQVEQSNLAREQDAVRQADLRQATLRQSDLRQATLRQETEAAPEEPVVDAPEADTLAAYSDLPFLHELAETDQNSIPSLMYSKHNYEEGVVVINKRSLREGDAAASGIVIERLLADGVVLRSDLHSFRLSAMSSWVNR